MDQIIKAAGGEPKVPAEALRAPLVLTLDELMPESIGDWMDKPIVHLGVMLGISITQTVGAIAVLKRGQAQGQKQQKPEPHLKSVPQRPVTPPTPPPAPAQTVVVPQAAPPPVVVHAVIDQTGQDGDSSWDAPTF